ncbi:AMSH-like protease sst2 [Neolecta irregularis DAH-3]|uniref:AMSH-like protease sst2 n=1 Tax=Neolecta irregularis (strain DAH-3) TaxID=1198029 RepID=A0A1U7LJJ9_NEOID|nr:AMSH-like protease sst2 [Neolecta irregularis DAH-3]|eukprot:OLL22819.1 AMSH-like protease sst2 [Neolecta irregularis DAH-3]
MAARPGHSVLSSQEIAKEAANFAFPDGKSLDLWLNTANLLYRQAIVSIGKGDNRTAYEYGMRYADIVINRIGKHPDYSDTSIRPKLKRMLKAVEKLLDLLEPVRTAIDNEYNSFLENERLLEAHKAELDRQSAFRHRSKSSLDSINEPSTRQAWDIVKEMQGLIIQQVKMKREAEVQEQKFSYPQISQSSSSDVKSQDIGSPSRSVHSVGPRPVPTTQTLPERPTKEILADSIAEISSPRPVLKDASIEDGVPPVEDIQILDRQFACRAFLESGEPLRSMFVPSELRTRFLEIASYNTARNLETCGVLCGLLKNNAFHANMLVIPAQESTSDTCATTDEETLFEFQERRDLLTLGWIHTHPSQTCFLSSVDLHTHCSYQLMLPEAIAIVCAPKHKPDWGAFRLTGPPGMHIIKNCRARSLFHQHDGGPIYCDAMYPGHVREVPGMKFEWIDLR